MANVFGAAGWLTEEMSELPDELTISGVVLSLLDAGEGISCWSGAVDGAGAVHVIIEPAGQATAGAVATATTVIEGFPVLTAAASAFLVAELADARWNLDDADRQRLGGEQPPFDLPEAVIWQDGSWMLRFAECGLAMGAEYGIGVLFEGTTPVDVEDLSEVDPEDAD